MPSTTSRKSLQYIDDEVEFYAHQVEGVRTMAKMNSFILADEMGLGKSLQALTVAAIDYEKGWASLTLVVAPASLKYNWLEEIQEHTSFKALVLDGTPDQRGKQLQEFDEGDFHILIVNYEQVKAHLDELNAFGFDIIIYDEAHFIKNHKSQRTKACQGLKGGRHFLLTGSPMLNQPDELWSLLYRIDRNVGNYYRFRHRYCVMGGYKDKQVVGVKNTDELNENLHAVMIRRLKKDALDLPEKQHIPVYVDLTPLQRRLYTEVVEEMKLTLPTDPEPTEHDIENALTKYLRLKQICGTPATFGYEDRSEKLDRAQEMAEEIVIDDEEHLVIFTQFRDVLAAMEARLANNKPTIPTFVLHGDVAKQERQARVGEWKRSGPSVMLAMLQVAGVGLNMTAANKCIFLDKLYVPKLNDQAVDRLHRIGMDETKPVQVWELITRNTVEQRIEKILKRKEKLFDTIVETSAFRKALYEALMEEAT